MQAVALAMILSPVVGRTAASAANRHFERGKRLLDEMEDRQALAAFREALGEAEDDRQRARIHLHLGIAHFNTMEHDLARIDFETAIGFDPRLALPSVISPKIRELFNEAKARLAPNARTSPARPAPQRPRDDGSGALLAAISYPTWISLGSTLLFAGFGVGLGVAASASNDEAQDTTLDSAAAQTAHDRARREATGANVMIALTAVVAASSALLIWLDLRRARASRAGASDPRPGAAVAALPGGAALRLTW